MFIVFIKKECYYTTTVGANEGRMKFTSILPSAAQLVRSKCTVTFSMRKRQKPLCWSIIEGIYGITYSVIFYSAILQIQIYQI